MTQNIKISFNLLLIVLLSVAISNVLPELPVLEEIVEVEEAEEFESHVEPFLFQSYAQVTGAGDDEVTYLASIISSEIFHLKKQVEIQNDFLPIRVPSLRSTPFFILYCSLIVYS